MTEPLHAKVSEEDYNKVVNAMKPSEPNFPRFDRDTLYNYIWEVVGKKVGYGIDCDVLADQVCDAVMEWVPKKGDFWLNEGDGILYVNKGWEIVTVEGCE